MIGVVLPVLPTTPFLLLAAYCFAQSSDRWHAWLLNNKYFGGLIQSWETNRCISKQTKIVALTSMFLVGGVSAWFAIEATGLRVMVFVLMLAGATVVLRIPTCTND